VSIAVSATSRPPLLDAHRWLAVVVLGIATFTIVTTEFARPAQRAGLGALLGAWVLSREGLAGVMFFAAVLVFMSVSIFRWEAVSRPQD
jgi:predicted MFS family arabinose efflux permease